MTRKENHTVMDKVKAHIWEAKKTLLNLLESSQQGPHALFNQLQDMRLEVRIYPHGQKMVEQLDNHSLPYLIFQMNDKLPEGMPAGLWKASKTQTTVELLSEFGGGKCTPKLRVDTQLQNFWLYISSYVKEPFFSFKICSLCFYENFVVPCWQNPPFIITTVSS